MTKVKIYMSDGCEIEASADNTFKEMCEAFTEAPFYLATNAVGSNVLLARDHIVRIVKTN